MRYLADDALLPTCPQEVEMAQLTYNLTEHPNGLPASDRFSLLLLTLFPKSATTTPLHQSKIVRRASHRKGSEEPGMNTTDYNIFSHHI